MRTIFWAALAATTLLPGVAHAQSAREVRQNQREIERGQAEVARDLRRGDYREAREDMQELREDRREAREDWREYRRTNREAFRAGTYRGPSGYRYRPVATGYRFAPTYYGTRYTINPGTYRLPRAGANQRWVRYGNDVVLVNVRNGRVITAHRDFFW